MFLVENPTRDEVTVCRSFLVLLVPGCCGFFESGDFLECAAGGSVQANLVDVTRRPFCHGAQLHHRIVGLALVIISVKRYTNTSCC